MKQIKPKKQRIKEGDVLAIPLPNGKYAFGREFKHGLGIYDYIAADTENLPNGCNRFLFLVGVYRDVLASGIWPKVGVDLNIKNNSPVNLHGFIVDALNGQLELYDYETGETKSSNKQACFGLERVSAWDSENVINRIMDTINFQKSSELESDMWVPDIIEIDPEGNISKRITFDDWKKSK